MQTSKIQLCNCTNSYRIYQQARDFKSAAYTYNSICRNNYLWFWVGNLLATEKLVKSRVLIAGSISEEWSYKVLDSLYWTCANYCFSRLFCITFLLLIFKQQSLNSPCTPNCYSLPRAMCGPVFSYGRFIVRKRASLFSAVFLEISMSFGRKFYLRKKKDWRSLMGWKKSGHWVKTAKLQTIQKGVL